MIPQVLVPLAHGFEEIEATCPIDLLKRAEVEVVLASCETELEVCGRSGIIIRTDQFLMETKPDRFDLLVIPGGPAVFELRKNKAILSLIQKFADKQRPIAAICAAPLLLKDAGLLSNKSITGHGCIVEELPQINTEQAVVIDSKIITSRGAGTAVEFGLSLVELLRGSEVASTIRESIHA
jgi:4-methyl-5(b-hydroxyethyl)-thiazole monophosphate biosynthesis